MITQAYLQRLLHYDPVTGVFTWRVSHRGTYRGTRAGFIDHGYRRICIDGKKYYEHRLAWFYVHGAWPSKNIDHKNRNTANNTMTELRLATQSQNLGNKIKNRKNTSGYKGVFSNNGYWMARIQVNKVPMYLGNFKTKQQAHAAYVAAAKRYFGAFARAA